MKIIMKTFIQSQFNYCPLVWMVCNRTQNNKINILHERALRLVYNNENLSFDELLDLDNSVANHHRNLQRFTVEMYKVKTKLSTLPMQEIFAEQTSTYDLRNKRCWEIPKVRTVTYGNETVHMEDLKYGNLYQIQLKNQHH